MKEADGLGTMDRKVVYRLFKDVPIGNNSVPCTLDIPNQTPYRTVGICRRKQYVCVKEYPHHSPGLFTVPLIQIAFRCGKLRKAILRVDLYRKSNSRPKQNALFRCLRNE